MLGVHTLLNQLFSILLMLTASHTCYTDLKSLRGIVANCLIQHYAFSSAMCRIYHVSLKLLPTMYHTGQSDISHDIVYRCHEFLSKYKFSNNQAIRHIAE